MKTIKTLTTASCFAVLAIAAITLHSCKKDSTSNPDSSISLLTSARWTFQNFQYEKPDGTWIPDPDAVDADKFTIGFATNNTLSEFDDAYNLTIPGTWSFSSNNTVLTTTGSSDLPPAAYTVNTLNSTTLVLTQLNYPHYNGYIDERLTFTH